MTNKIDKYRKNLESAAAQIKPTLVDVSYEDLNKQALEALEEMTSNGTQKETKSAKPEAFLGAQARLYAILTTLKERQDKEIDAFAAQDLSQSSYIELGEKLSECRGVPFVKRWKLLDFGFDMYKPEDFAKVGMEIAIKKRQAEILAADYEQGEAQAKEQLEKKPIAESDVAEAESVRKALVSLKVYDIANDLNSPRYGKQKYIIGYGLGYFKTYEAAILTAMTAANQKKKDAIILPIVEAGSAKGFPEEVLTAIQSALGHCVRNDQILNHYVKEGKITLDQGEASYLLSQVGWKYASQVRDLMIEQGALNRELADGLDYKLFVQPMAERVAARKAISHEETPAAGKFTQTLKISAPQDRIRQILVGDDGDNAPVEATGWERNPSRPGGRF